MPKLTANGGNNPSAMHNGMTWKRRMRVEKAAQLTALGVLSDAEIARHIGITQAAFSVLKTTGYFKTVMINLSTGILSQETQAVARTIEYQREEIADMVPLALQNLRRIALSSKPELALKASLEILDRDGKHSKVSRTSVTVENHVDLSVVNATGNNILNILKAHAPEAIPEDPNNPTTINGTLAPEQDINSVLDEFTRNAKDAKAQVNAMADVVTEVTLETIDSASKTVQ